MAIAAEARRYNLLLSDDKRDLAAARLMPSGPWNDATVNSFGGSALVQVAVGLMNEAAVSLARTLLQETIGLDAGAASTLQQALVGIENGRFGKGVYSLIDEVGDNYKLAEVPLGYEKRDLQTRVEAIEQLRMVYGGDELPSQRYNRFLADREVLERDLTHYNSRNLNNDPIDSGFSLRWSRIARAHLEQGSAVSALGRDQATAVKELMKLQANQRALGGGGDCSMDQFDDDIKTILKEAEKQATDKADAAAEKRATQPPATPAPFKAPATKPQEGKTSVTFKANKANTKANAVRTYICGNCQTACGHGRDHCPYPEVCRFCGESSPSHRRFDCPEKPPSPAAAEPGNGGGPAASTSSAPRR